MSNTNISMYTFKPFNFKVLKKKNHGPKIQQKLNPTSIRNNLCMVCNDDHLIICFITEDKETELWKYCFLLCEWKQIICQNTPHNLFSFSVVLSDNMIIIYGNTSIPVDVLPLDRNPRKLIINRVFCGNLNDEYKEGGMKLEELQNASTIPRWGLGQRIVIDGKYIFAIGAPSSDKNELEVDRLDLSTKSWESLYKVDTINYSEECIDPHQMVFYNERIYIFGGRRGNFYDRYYYGFSKILTFDVTTKQWNLLPATKHHNTPDYPNKTNYGHSCIQCPGNRNLVYMCGGFNDFGAINDVWRFDLNTLQWKNLYECKLPIPFFFSSSAVSPAGRLYCYNGLEEVFDCLGYQSNDIISSWITTPTLKIVSWEAMVYYFKEQMFESSIENLKRLGIPEEFYNKIIEAKKMNTMLKHENN